MLSDKTFLFRRALKCFSIFDRKFVIHGIGVVKLSASSLGLRIRAAAMQCRY